MKYLILLAIILAMISIQYGQAAPADSIRTTDSLGNEITPSLNEMVYFQYDAANGYTNVKDFNIELFIIMDDNNEQLFYKNQQLQLNPDEWKTITWSFVPEKTGNYTSKIIINGISHSYGFIITDYARDDEVSLEVKPVKVKFGDDITIHASLPSYEKPDDLRYYIDVFDLEGRKVDSTLWFARTDFNYTMRTEHPAFNITRAGDYTIYVEKALNIERAGEIVKTTSFTIITNPPPLKQVDRGISPANVICNDNLGLILKTKDGSPACVKPETKIKLIERGWAKDILDKDLTDKKIPVDYGVPDDFRVSSLANGIITLDTQKNLYLPDMCAPPIEFKLDLSGQEKQQIWQSVKDNNFFELGDFIYKCSDLESCVVVTPEIILTLNITANGKTHSVTHHNSYFKTKYDSLDKFENIVGTLGKIVLQKNELNNFTAPRCGLQ